MTSIFLTLVLAYVLLLLYMVLWQRKLMYFPDTQIEPPGHYGLNDFEDLRLKNADGLTLQLWYKKAAQGYPTITYFHGNAMHLGNRAGIFAALAEAGFGVSAISYRGYGKSEGSPTEGGIYTDARRSMQFLLEEQHIPVERILLFGESLGTGVAVQMATEYNVAGLILQAAYTSVAQRAAEIYFYVPVKLLIHDRFDSLSKIGQVKAPLMMFHGEQDQVIPIRQGKALLAAATSPKQAFFFPQFSHNDFDSHLISAHVLDFAREQQLIP